MLLKHKLEAESEREDNSSGATGCCDWFAFLQMSGMISFPVAVKDTADGVPTGQLELALRFGVLASDEPVSRLTGVGVAGWCPGELVVPAPFRI